MISNPKYTRNQTIWVIINNYLALALKHNCPHFSFKVSSRESKKKGEDVDARTRCPYRVLVFICCIKKIRMRDQEDTAEVSPDKNLITNGRNILSNWTVSAHLSLFAQAPSTRIQGGVQKIKCLFVYYCSSYSTLDTTPRIN